MAAPAPPIDLLEYLRQEIRVSEGAFRQLPQRPDQNVNRNSPVTQGIDQWLRQLNPNVARPVLSMKPPYFQLQYNNDLGKLPYACRPPIPLQPLRTSLNKKEVKTQSPCTMQTGAHTQLNPTAKEFTTRTGDVEMEKPTAEASKADPEATRTVRHIGELIQETTNEQPQQDASQPLPVPKLTWFQFHRLDKQLGAVLADSRPHVNSPNEVNENPVTHASLAELNAYWTYVKDHTKNEHDPEAHKPIYRTKWHCQKWIDELEDPDISHYHVTMEDGWTAVRRKGPSAVLGYRGPDWSEASHGDNAN